MIRLLLTNSRWTLIALLFCLEVASAQSSNNGRDIFEGRPGSPLDYATAEISEMGVTLPASSFPCSSCHGEDGRGRAERGIVPSDLRQSVLRRDLNVVEAGQRARLGYNEDSFYQALTTGIDASGNKLNSTMPRFNLSREDVIAIWNYLDKLDQAQDVGVSDQYIELGVFQSESESESAQRAVRKILTGFVDRLNRAGGLYGRQLNLHFFSETETPEVFAVLVPNHHLAPDTERVIIGTRVTGRNTENTFRLLPDEGLQASALRKFAVEQLGRVKPLIEECQIIGDGTLITGTVFCTDLSNDEGVILLTHSAFDSWARSGVRKSPKRMFVALPFGNDQVNQEAQQAFGRLRSQVTPHQEDVMAQAEAYSALVVLLEALTGTGRSLSQKRLINRLQLISKFDGALMPPVTFSINRRVGSSGNLIAEFDLSTGSFDFESAVWIDPFEQ